ncbi:MAG: hypothetical protein ACC628_02660 [Pirellulaceae bacterium]
MRAFAACIIACCATAWIGPGTACAQNGSTPLEFHAWARYGNGSWKLVRVLTETFDKDGRIESVSTTETKTTLVDVTDNRYTLNVETTVKVAGKRFPSEPKTVTQGLHGDTLGQTVTTRAGGVGDVVINGRRYRTRIKKIVINGDGMRRSDTLHFSDQVPPFVLKRETKGTDVEGNVLYDSSVQVMAVNMPFKVLTQIKPSSFVKTVQRQRNGSSTVAVEIHCADVPGSVVSHSWKELDGAGKVVRRKTLELVDYEARTPTKDPTTSSSQRKRVIVKPRLIDRLRARKSR